MKTRILILLLFLTGSVQAGPIINPYIFATAPTPALVQQKTGTTASGDLTITMDSALTAGNAVIACISYVTPDSITGAETTGSVDNLSADIQETSGTGIGVDIWSNTNVTGGTLTVVIHANTGATRITANVSEWSNIGSGIENSKSASGLASTTVVTDDGSHHTTPSSARNVVIACGAWTANNYSSGPTDSFTRMTAAGTGAVRQETAYKIQTTATAANPSWTLTSGINWAGASAAYGAP